MKQRLLEASVSNGSTLSDTRMSEDTDKDASMEISSVYFLRDPRDMQPRYIGISKRPHIRFAEHWTNRNVDYMHKGRTLWLREIDSIGMRPILDVAISGLDRIQAIRCEAILLDRWSKILPGRLLQDTSPNTVFVDHETVTKKIDTILSKCSPSCRRAVIAHLQGLPS